MDSSKDANDGQLRDDALAKIVAERLAPQHLDELRKSGLSDETIVANGLYTEHNRAKVRRLLNWQWSASKLGPCLVFPFRDVSGQPINFARLKPTAARSREGKDIKYEQPIGHEIEPYFPSAAIEAVSTPGAMIGVTEGEKKSLAATQAGLPCIGLTGANCGAKSPRDPNDNKKTGPPALLAALMQIDWQGRQVWIGADTDDEYKAMVGYGFAEFVRLISEQGAEPFMLDMPRVRGEDGRCRKMAIDDFLVARGPDAFRHLVEQTRKPVEHKTIEEYRRELALTRVTSLDHPGIYLDRSPTGAGKSYADIEAMRRAKRSLTILQSHKNCKEAEKTLQKADLIADAYPKLDNETCLNLVEAQQAMDAGLAPTASVCRKCPHKDKCSYQYELEIAKNSPHSIATMHRASLSFRELAKRKPYIAVHEDPASFLRPEYEVKDGFERVVTIARQAQGDAMDRTPPDMDSKFLFYTLESAAIWLPAQLNASDQTTTLTCPVPAANTQHCDLRLWEAMKHLSVYPDGDVMRICRAVATGAIDEITVRVDRHHDKNGKLTGIRKAILAVFKTELPTDATIWIADATATVTEIEALVGRPVVDATPGGQIEQKHPVCQLAVDIKQETASSVVIRHVRAVLSAFPDAKKVGVITHKKHVYCIEGTARAGTNLDDDSRTRIAKVDYFRSGGSRGSNEWIEECDLLIVAGTPRPNPAAIAKRLVQLGKAAAAARDGKWSTDWWNGQTVSGKRVTVKTLGYGDWDWRDAYEAIVGAELTQSVGRARAVCDTGIPVVVISTHKIGKTGFRLVDQETCQSIGESQREVLTALKQLTEQVSIGSVEKPIGATLYSNNIESCSVSSSEIASVIGKTDRYARKILEGLEKAGLVERIGQRGGWKMISEPDPLPANGAEAGEKINSAA